MKRRQRRYCGAFSLVELLVVIGIIVILVGILIPVVSKVKQASYAANTKNEISQIEGACERYYQDFGAYPGPFSNDQLEGQGPQGTGIFSPDAPTAAGGPTTPLNFANNIPAPGLTSGGFYPQPGQPVATATKGQYVTSSENLVLGLMGGLEYQASVNGVGSVVCDPYPIGFIPPGAGATSTSGLVGGGPLNLNPQSSTGSSQPYLTDMAYLSNNYATGQHYAYQGQTGISAMDSAIPVFVDQYPDAMPILYMRARKGAHGVVCNYWGGSNTTDAAGATTIINDPISGKPAHYQYDIFELDPYTLQNSSTKTSIGVPQPAGGNPANNGLQDLDTHYTYYSTPQPLATYVTNPNSWYDNAISYLYNPAVAPPAPPNDQNYYGAPQRADSYILITAGPDRCYGTADDITNFGNVR